MKVKNIGKHVLSGRSAVGMIELPPGEEADIPMDIIKRQKWLERKVAVKVDPAPASPKKEEVSTKVETPKKPSRMGFSSKDSEEDDD